MYPAALKAATAVLDELPLVDVIGSPRFADVTKPWIYEITNEVFGSFNPDTGRRDKNEFFILVAKKNSKSTLAAAVMVTALVINHRQSAEFIIVAPTIEVANNSFKPAADMCRTHEHLNAMMIVQDHTRTITNSATGATLKVISAENDTISGKKASGVFIDELWLFGKRANAANMLLEATGGLASRPEGFVIYASTQSDEPPAGVFLEKLNYFRKVKIGEIVDKQAVPFLYEWSKEELEAEAWRDEKLWHKVNPNLGASVDIAYLQREYKKANDAGGNQLIQFCAKHLNVEIGISLKNDYWVGASYWDACAGRVTLEKILEESETIDVGIDGGGLDDMLGLAVVGRAGAKWMLWTHAWVHPIALERRKSEADRYGDFMSDGDLTIVKEMGDDLYEISRIVSDIADTGKLDMVGIDPSGSGIIVDALTETGIDEKKIVGINQGWRLTSAIKTLERRLSDSQIRHCGSRMMQWCVGNAKIELRGNAVTMTKQQSGVGKIDPLMATLNAVELMSRNKTDGSMADYLKAGPIGV